MFLILFVKFNINHAKEVLKFFAPKDFEEIELKYKE